MTGAVVVAVVIVVVGTALGLVRHIRDRQRIREIDEIQQILEQARARKNRTHLHLLIAIPLAWLAGRFQSPTARLAAATAASLVVGSSFVAVDGHNTPPQLAPPAAGAETTEPTPTVDGDDAPSYAHLSSRPTSSTTTSAAAQPPAPAAVAPGSAPNPIAPPLADPAPTPAPTTTTTIELLEDVTTTTVLEVTTSTTVCLNPHGIPIPKKVCA